MKLKIENFGPIKKGEIDLSKRFYLLVGYNNTGKTYLSKLLFHVFNQDTIDSFIKSEYYEEIGIEMENSLKITLTQSLIERILAKFSQYLQEVIRESFHVEKEHFIFESFELRFEYEWEYIVESIANSFYGVEANFWTGTYTLFHLHKAANSAEIQAIVSQEDIPERDEKPISVENFEEDIKKGYIIAILNLLLENENTPIFIPANRIYILENYEYVFRREKEKREELSKAFFKGKNIKGLLVAMKSNYTEPVNILIDEIYKISESNKEKLPYYNNILQKLATLMGGKIVTNKERFNGNDKYYFQVPHKRKQKDIPFYLASSSVNQLSILYLYFEYFVKEKNNFLILDEPEENLHPETQILLMNLLFEFANMNGNKVLMTTHSPLLADVVNNYYYLAYLKQEKIEIPKGIEKYPFDTAIDFLPKDLGVYFFGKGKMQEYVFDKYGASFFDFDKEIRKIKDMGEILTDAIFNHENNTK